MGGIRLPRIEIQPERQIGYLILLYSKQSSEGQTGPEMNENSMKKVPVFVSPSDMKAASADVKTRRTNMSAWTTPGKHGMRRHVSALSVRNNLARMDGRGMLVNTGSKF